mmetsp:Transcript_28365/g.66040  ORF Transcript_28365/g.66040 Transcript_28365/m.66040 type:complete len:443 (+) Transcript_28365:256-1584(+)
MMRNRSKNNRKKRDNSHALFKRKMAKWRKSTPLIHVNDLDLNAHYLAGHAIDQLGLYCDIVKKWRDASTSVPPLKRREFVRNSVIPDLIRLGCRFYEPGTNTTNGSGSRQTLQPVKDPRSIENRILRDLQNMRRGEERVKDLQMNGTTTAWNQNQVFPHANDQAMHHDFGTWGRGEAIEESNNILEMIQGHGEGLAFQRTAEAKLMEEATTANDPFLPILEESVVMDDFFASEHLPPFGPPGLDIAPVDTSFPSFPFSTPSVEDNSDDNNKGKLGGDISMIPCKVPSSSSSSSPLSFAGVPAKRSLLNDDPPPMPIKKHPAFHTNGDNGPIVCPTVLEPRQCTPDSLASVSFRGPRTVSTEDSSSSSSSLHTANISATRADSTRETARRRELISAIEGRLKLMERRMKVQEVRNRRLRNRLSSLMEQYHGVPFNEESLVPDC